MSEAIVTDKTLTIEDAPADAKATGDAINNLRGAVGSPLVAATAAAMTDTNKVYVYTGSETGYTNGNWYYHDGTSWVSGGVYNSVAIDLDSTLILANKAPDSKVVGDEIGELKENITNIKSALEDSNSAVSQINEQFSDNNALLSGSLNDKSSTSSGVAYSLTGNVVTVNGTATGASLFVILGSTTAAPPSWLIGGQQYIVKITNNTSAEIWLQGKRTSDNALIQFVVYQSTGKYIFTVPSDITTFRLGIYVSPGTTVNGTITIEMSNIIKLLKLDENFERYFALSADDSIVIPDYTDFNALLTPGTFKVTNITHANTMSNMPFATAGKLVVMTTSQAARKMQMFFCVSDPFSIYWRNYNGTAWMPWYEVQKRNAVLKPMWVQYSVESSNSSTESIMVYIPSLTGYIGIKFVHYESVAKNCNAWQLGHVYSYNQLFSNAKDLTVKGEWECALRLNGRSDFSGGFVHGNEIMEGITFLIDGKPIDISEYTSKTSCKSVEIIETSTIYDQADGTTPIAEHGRRYTFTKDGLQLDQSIKWLVAEALGNCFLAMFPPSKNYIDRASVNSDFEVLTLPSATGESLTTIVKNNADSASMWDTSSGFSARVSVPVYPTGLTDGDQVSISDNGGNNYNKLYFKVCGGGTSNVGELWKSTTIYNLSFID